MACVGGRRRGVRARACRAPLTLERMAAARRRAAARDQGQAAGMPLATAGGHDAAGCLQQKSNDKGDDDSFLTRGDQTISLAHTNSISTYLRASSCSAAARAAAAS